MHLFSVTLQISQYIIYYLQKIPELFRLKIVFSALHYIALGGLMSPYSSPADSTTQRKRKK